MFWFNKEKSKIQQWKENNVFNTETMLPISEIKWNTLIMKDGSIRAIVKLTWVNIDLRNYEEQEAIVEQYKKFINWLWFPIQILVRNDYLELSDYINYMRWNIDALDTWLLKEQWEWYIDFLDDINKQQGLLFIKHFYIVIPYYPAEKDEDGIKKPRWQKFLDAMSAVDTPEKVVERYRIFLKNQKYLDTRVAVISDSLKWLWVEAQRLSLTDIISLLFSCYNPDAHKTQAEFV